MRRLRVVVYDDAWVFGGHELMLAEAVRGLVELGGAEVLVVMDERNERFRQRIAGFATCGGALRTATIQGDPGRLPGRGPFIRAGRLVRVRSILQRARPDLVIVAQGGIAVGIEGLLAARAVGVPTISYLAVAHSILGAERWPRAAWLAAGLFARLPHAFIVVCEAMKELLVARRVRKPIAVVHNGIDLSRCVRRERVEARRRLGCGEGHFLIGVIGRLECRQKGQDTIIACLPEIRASIDNVRLVLVGDGPDHERLGRLISQHGVEREARILEWHADPSWIYSALDMLVIPSRYEGEPLVMLEAMAYELPIAASAADGMAEILPKEWLAPVGNSGALVEVIARLARRTDPQVLRANLLRVRAQFSLETFRTSFRDAVQAFARGDGVVSRAHELFAPEGNG